MERQQANEFVRWVKVHTSPRDGSVSMNVSITAVLSEAEVLGLCVSAWFYNTAPQWPMSRDIREPMTTMMLL